eukprot:TRINITY_DN6273_c0_g2_i1.p1 TRINITY_DN6273_c0_g2~~TRINITY_DN6273_c0_g2_i1.p1  ORF type:complete len:409 (-),score=80.68 TRINITY_DN6273_c0_g2_i1:170-1396(-)
MGYFVYKFSSTILLIFLALSWFEPEPPSERRPSFLASELPLVLAHRGSRNLNPENTFLAFRNALAFGADVIETDVSLTADGHLVVHHDATVDRTTNGSGFVRSKTLAEIKSLDAGYHYSPDGKTNPFRGTGLAIPTLAEYLDEFPRQPTNIEIKDDEPLAAELFVAEIARRPGIEKHIVVGGRHCSSVRHFRELCKRAGLRVASSACEIEATQFVVLSWLRLSRLWYTYVERVPFDVFQLPVQSGPARMDTAELLRNFRVLGLDVHYWVINTADEMKRLLRLGARGIVTDRPDIAADAFAELGVKPALDKTESLQLAQQMMWFEPNWDPAEGHTCVSPTCIVLQNMEVVLAFVASFGIAALILKHMLCTPELRATAPPDSDVDHVFSKPAKPPGRSSQPPVPRRLVKT